MASSLFRFVVLRPPQRVADDGAPVERVKTHPDGTRSAILGDLQRLRDAGDRAGMRRISRSFVDSPQFIKDLESLGTPVTELDAFLLQHRDSPSRHSLEDAAKKLMGQVAKSVRSADFRRDRTSVADSMLAATLAARPAEQSVARLKRAMRIFVLVERLAASPPSITRPGDVRRALRARIVLPRTLYPLPREKRQPTSQPAATGDARKRAAELTNHLSRLQAAIEELSDGYAQDRLRNLEPQTGDDGVSSPEPRRGTSKNPVVSRFGTGPSFLSEAARAGLGEDTHALLGQMNVPLGGIRVPTVVAALESRAAELSGRLYGPRRGVAMVPIGDTFMPDYDVVGGGDFVLGDYTSLIPGPCRHPAVDDPLQTDEIMPAGGLHSMGVGDLMLVEQELQRYELGEIAHIENVLIGELKERTHRRTQTTEETVVVETETVEESERELETTERFELQRETQQVIKEDTSREAGVTLSGNYGTVDFTADARYASETATEDSQSTATTHARDVTERAVSRIQERVREQRTRRTIDVIDETNLHTLNNVDGKTHTIGVYRWVEKLYRAQLVNYGRRALFEFVIPQPGAFLKFALGARPREGVSLTKPDAPGYCTAEGFVGLRPQDIGETGPYNYLYWAGLYGAAGVTPPPARYRIVAIALAESPAAGGSTKADNTVQVPIGYLAQNASLEGNRASPAAITDPIFSVHVGRHPASNFNFQVTLDDEDQIVPVGILTWGVDHYAFTLEIECQRSEAHFEAWQLGTHTAIMTAYNERLAQYNDRLAAIQVEEGPGGLGGRNPLSNRQLEQTELKRGAISILTGQHFDRFDALRKDVPPHGYPQLDLGEAALEGPFIRFFEQAFEWENMVYLFYPYFWGRKEDWTRDATLDDFDPLFAQFLRSGAARLVVPARPGFEAAIASYLQNGWPIPDEADPALPEDGDGQGLPMLSIVDEIKAQQGYSATPGDGTLTTTQGATGVVGANTAFDSDRDADREIHIDGVRYRIKEVGSETQVTLTEAYTGPSDQGLHYSLGVRYVGEPWAVRVPTSLVRLQEDAALPTFG